MTKRSNRDLSTSLTVSIRRHGGRNKSETHGWHLKSTEFNSEHIQTEKKFCEAEFYQAFIEGLRPLFVTEGFAPATFDKWVAGSIKGQEECCFRCQLHMNSLLKYSARTPNFRWMP